MKFIVEWQVSDGYSGRARPQTTEFDTDDIEGWDELSEKEKNRYIRQAVQDDFEQKISFIITN